MKALHTIQHHVVMLLDKHVVQVFWCCTNVTSHDQLCKLYAFETMLALVISPSSWPSSSFTYTKTKGNNTHHQEDQTPWCKQYSTKVYKHEIQSMWNECFYSKHSVAWLFFTRISSKNSQWWHLARWLRAIMMQLTRLKHDGHVFAATTHDAA
jgi:hypothetical protein